MAVFSSEGVRVALPDAHPLRRLELRDGAGRLLVAQPLPSGEPLVVPLEYGWAPGEPLSVVGGAGGRVFSLSLVAPTVRPPPVTVTLELPAGVPAPPGEAPLLLPAGSEAPLALTVRSHTGKPLRLRVFVERPPALGPLAEKMGRMGDSGGKVSPATARELQLDLKGQTERVEFASRTQPGTGWLRWRILGSGLETPLSGRRTITVLPPGRMRNGLRARDEGFPADGSAHLLTHQPRDRLIFQQPWAQPLLAWLGRGELRDPYQPVGYARVVVSNALEGEVVGLLRTWVAAAPKGAPLAAFADPLSGGSALPARKLVRVPARGESTVAQPLYFDQSRVAPGRYWRCSQIAPWGMEGVGALDCVPFRVVASPLWGWGAIWAGTALGVGLFLWALLRLPRWMSAFPLRDLTLIALMAGLAFLLVSLPGMVLRTVTLFLLGPFNFLVEGLVFKGLLFFLLGCLFALVRRPGVFFLFYCLWMVAQALLNGHTSPSLVLFAGVTITLVEGGLWVGGVTRSASRGPGARLPWLWAALAVGMAEGLSVFWGIQLLKVLFRVFYADWFVWLQSSVEGCYAAVGTAAGLWLGRRLEVLRRPGLAHGRKETTPSHPAHRERAPVKLPPGVPLLEVEGLTYGYPGAEKPVLSGLDFSIHPGEVVLLAGNSGAGKTTLFRLLKGLLPWPGEAVWRMGGEPVGEAPPWWWAGLLFQEPGLQVVRSTVAGEVAFGLELQGGRPEVIQQRVEAQLRAFGLEALAGRHPSRLSGGELQKTALAAVLAPHPPLLLLDEPLAHLDSKGRVGLLERLRGLARQGVGIVVAEHRTEAMLPFVDRVVLLEPGLPSWQGQVDAFRRTSWRRAALEAATAPAPLPPALGALFPSGKTAPVRVELSGVGFRHQKGGVAVLENVSATLEPGMAVALTGANGAGKTTLLNLLLGLRRPTEGRVTLGGSHPRRNNPHHWGWAEKARQVGYLPQQADSVLQASTVAQELAMSLRWRGGARGAVEGLVREWLRLTGLTEAAGQFPHLLSRGERQRLALAAVMIAGPPLLVLDEPFAGQDAHQTARVLALCEAYLQSAPGRGLIAATHDLGPTERFFHQQWRLEEGRLSVEEISSSRARLPKTLMGLAAEGGA